MFQNNCQAGRDKARQVIIPENYSYGTSPRITLCGSRAAPGQPSLQIPSLESATAHAQRTKTIRKGGGGVEPRKEKQTSGLPEKGR